MPGVEFSTKFLWSTRLDSAMNPELSATNIAIDTTNPYFQSINGETTQNVSFAFGPFMGSQNLTDYNNIQVFMITPKLTVDLPFGDWQANRDVQLWPQQHHRFPTDRSIRGCWLNRCAG